MVVVLEQRSGQRKLAAYWQFTVNKDAGATLSSTGHVILKNKYQPDLCRVAILRAAPSRAARSLWW